MSELVFPVAAFALTFVVLVPLLSLAALGVLALQRRRTLTWSAFGSLANLALLVGPTLLPVAWLLSSAFHQSESAQNHDACLLEHGISSTCIDAALLLGMVALWSLVVVGRTWHRDWSGKQHTEMEPLSDGAVQRVRGLCDGRASLRGLRVMVVAGAPDPVFVTGLLRPRVVVDAAFVRAVDDDVLVAALLHEQAHVRHMDTLLGFILRICLAANPARRLLMPDARRWLNAREALCDQAAVVGGGAPLALAQGLVQALRLRNTNAVSEQAVALCGRPHAELRLRIALLMNGLPTADFKSPRNTAPWGLIILLAAATLAPHIDGYGVLEHFHLMVEQGVHSLGN